MILSKKFSLANEVEIFNIDQVAAKTGGWEMCSNIPTNSGHNVCGGDGKGGYSCQWVEEHDDSEEYCISG